VRAEREKHIRYVKDRIQAGDFARQASEPLSHDNSGCYLYFSEICTEFALSTTLNSVTSGSLVNCFTQALFNCRLHVGVGAMIESIF